MKKVFVVTGLIVFAALAAVAGNKAGEKSTLKVDAKASKVYWTAKKVTGEHTGVLSISDGTLVVNGGNITDASVKMDMTSIDCTDLQGEWKDKLIGHLKSDDFFSVANNPQASFATKSIKKSGSAYQVTGDLTIKGITNSITFPVDVKVSDKQLSASGTAKVDRTKWNIQYRSGKFFSDLGDNLIYDEFEIRFELVANTADEVSSL